MKSRFQPADRADNRVIPLLVRLIECVLEPAGIEWLYQATTKMKPSNLASQRSASGSLLGAWRLETTSAKKGSG
ncbi:hypothetical protein CKA34_31255 (plasmid) [Rhizobium sp. 11515TR]|nr:hypothetical protein CKA34_31255 [Rhizobium sp. 11515TR]